MKHNFLTLIVRTLGKKYEHEKKMYCTIFSAQNCDMMGKFCIQVLNQHMRINL